MSLSALYLFYLMKYLIHGNDLAHNRVTWNIGGHFRPLVEQEAALRTPVTRLQNVHKIIIILHSSALSSSVWLLHHCGAVGVALEEAKCGADEWMGLSGKFKQSSRCSISPRNSTCSLAAERRWRGSYRTSAAPMWLYSVLLHLSSGFVCN